MKVFFDIFLWVPFVIIGFILFAIVIRIVARILIKTWFDEKRKENINENFSGRTKRSPPEKNKTGALDNMLKRHHSPETKVKLSAINKGKKFSKETRKKMSISGKNKIFTEKHRKSLSIAQTGKTMTEEAKRKISIAFKGKKLSKEHILKRTIAQMKCRTDGYCDAWSDKEFKKDCKKDRCEICGTKFKIIQKSDGYTIPNLLLHHIDCNPKNCHPDNLQTLCAKCHTKLHFELKRKGEKI